MVICHQWITINDTVVIINVGLHDNQLLERMCLAITQQLKMAKSCNLMESRTKVTHDRPQQFYNGHVIAAPQYKYVDDNSLFEERGECSFKVENTRQHGNYVD